MVPPAATGLGVPLSVAVRSQATFTLVVTDVLLLAELGSDVVDETEDVAMIVPAAIVGLTVKTIRMSADAPVATLGFVQVTEVVAMQVHPAGAE